MPAPQNLQLQNPYLLKNLIEEAKKQNSFFRDWERSGDIHIFCKDGDDEPGSTPELVCYLDKINFDEKGYDEDGKSAFCVSNDLWPILSSEQFQRVIDVALQEKPSATLEELLISVDYYCNRDTFLDLSAPVVLAASPTCTPENLQSYAFNIFPNCTKDDLLKYAKEHGDTFAPEDKFFTFPQGVVWYYLDDRKRKDTLPLCQYISSVTGWALGVWILPQAKGWAHIFYHNMGIDSPAEYIIPGQERKKKPKKRRDPVAAAFASAFPQADLSLIEKYLYEQRKIETNTTAWDNPNLVFIEKNGSSYVSPQDKYACDDYRQAYDFARYLGFPIPIDLQ